MFEELKASDPDDNKDIEDRLFEALATHEKMEDEHFYPALEDALDDDENFEKLEDEQKVLEAQTMAARILPVGRTAALKMAMPKILEHAKMEEDTILARADEILSPEDNEAIGAKMEPMSATAATGA